MGGLAHGGSRDGGKEGMSFTEKRRIGEKLENQGKSKYLFKKKSVKGQQTKISDNVKIFILPLGFHLSCCRWDLSKPIKVPFLNMVSFIPDKFRRAYSVFFNSWLV